MNIKKIVFSRENTTAIGRHRNIFIKQKSKVALFCELVQDISSYINFDNKRKSKGYPCEASNYFSESRAPAAVEALTFPSLILAVLEALAALVLLDILFRGATRYSLILRVY